MRKNLFSVLIIISVSFSVLIFGGNQQISPEEQNLRNSLSELGLMVVNKIEYDTMPEKIYYDTCTISVEEAGSIGWEMTDKEKLQDSITITYPWLEVYEDKIMIKNCLNQIINTTPRKVKTLFLDKDGIPGEYKLSPVGLLCSDNNSYFAIVRQIENIFEGGWTGDVVIYNKNGEEEWSILNEDIIGEVIAVSPDGNYFVSRGDVFSNGGPVQIFHKSGEIDSIMRTCKGLKLSNQGETITILTKGDWLEQYNKNGIELSHRELPGQYGRLKSMNDEKVAYIALDNTRIYDYDMQDSTIISEKGHILNPIFIDDNYIFLYDKQANNIHSYNRIDKTLSHLYSPVHNKEDDKNLMSTHFFIKAEENQYNLYIQDYEYIKGNVLRKDIIICTVYFNENNGTPKIELSNIESNDAVRDILSIWDNEIISKATNTVFLVK